VIDQIDIHIIMKVMQWSSNRTPAILFSAYSYAGPSNFGFCGQIFWRKIRPYAR